MSPEATRYDWSADIEALGAMLSRMNAFSKSPQDIPYLQKASELAQDLVNQYNNLLAQS